MSSLVTIPLTACGASAPASPTATGTGSSSATPAVASSTTEAPEDVATDEPEPSPEPSFDAQPSDFEISLKILRKKCFGSAGCNVTYRIDPTYVGIEPIPDTGTVEVTYVVKGLEDGDAINTFTIEGEKASYQSEEDGSVASSKTKLTGKVTAVSYSPGG